MTVKKVSYKDLEKEKIDNEDLIESAKKGLVYEKDGKFYTFKMVRATKCRIDVVDDNLDEILEEFRKDFPFMTYICQKDEQVRKFDKIAKKRVKIETLLPSKIELDKEEVDAMKTFLSEAIVIPCIDTEKGPVMCAQHEQLYYIDSKKYKKIDIVYVDEDKKVLKAREKAEKAGVNNIKDCKLV